MTQNSPELWDKLWRDVTPNEDRFNLAQEELSIRWQRILSLVNSHFSFAKDLQVIEIGAGAGTNAALMAKNGAKVTILDYSPKALSRAKSFFKHNGLQATFIQADALNLPKELKGKFDIAMSFGLTEHFSGERRLTINQAHFDLLKPQGIAIISVPNAYNLPYRFFKVAAEMAKLWKVGEEYPYTRSEWRQLALKLGIKHYRFLGDNLWYSLNFINPIVIVRKLLGRKQTTDIKSLKLERGTPLDQYLSYSLVFVGFKD